MFDIPMLRVDGTCVSASMAKGASYEPCARRASLRALVHFIRDKFPKGELGKNGTIQSRQFSQAFLDRLTTYLMDATHSGIQSPVTTHGKLFRLMDGDTKRHENFRRILEAGILYAQDITDVPGSVADHRATRSPIELQFQAMANGVIIEVLEVLATAFTRYLESPAKEKLSKA